jgi:foldase protein PrsA
VEGSMAKRRIKKDLPLTRKQVSRREKERRQRLMLIGVAIAVGCLILAILGYGAYQEYVGKPSAPVATVNGVPISTLTYQKRVLLKRMELRSQMANLQLQLSLLDPEEAAFYAGLIEQQIRNLEDALDILNSEVPLEGLIEEELIRQAAQEQGVVVSPEELDRQIEENFGYFREQPTPAPSPTSVITATTGITPTEAPTPMTRAGFDELYGDYLGRLQEEAGVSKEDYREFVRTEMLWERMTELIGQQVSTTEPHVRARHILLDTEEEAEAVLERLQEGEDFEVLAREVSTDTMSAELGGDLGWFPKGKMDAAFEEVAFNLPVGEISEVVETRYGFHIILVEERDENRELDSATLDQRKQEAFEVWLADLKAKAEIEKFWSPDKVPPE